MAQMRIIGTNLDRGYRNDLNFNFSKLESLVINASNLTDEMRQEFLLKMADLQSQINALKVEEILALISQMEQAVINTNTAAALATSKAEYAEGEGDFAKEQGDYANAQGTYAKEKGDYANEKAILANEAAALAQQESANLGQMKIDVVNATQNAVTETQKAISATENAEQATTATIVATTNAENMRSVGAFALLTAYKKNNIVEDNGSSFIALQNTQNNPLPVLPNKSNAWWRLHAQKGDKGNDGTGVTILGSLANESELPPVGSPGDAYLVDGLDVDNNPIKNLYVWSDSTTSWTNAGNIQGPQGEPGQGIQGEKGDPGTTTWSGITDKPTAFPPSAHTHTIPQITGLEDALELKFTVADGGELDDLTTVTKDNLVAAINEINAKPTGGDTTEIAKQINTLYKLSTSIMREQAYMKLLQDASERVDGGTVFAHDMNGNLIGMTLDEANSQNIVIRDGKMLMLSKGEVTKTIADATVLASAEDTSGNGGRKVIRLNNGNLYFATKTATSHSIHQSKDYLATAPTFFTGSSGLTSVVDTALATNGRFVYRVTSIVGGNTGLNFSVLDEDKKIISAAWIDTGQTAVGNCTVVINPEGTEIHVAYASKNATYPNSFNIRYAKGIISQVDGSVTWGAVVQVTKSNTTGLDFLNPSIVYNDIEPIILVTRTPSGNPHEVQVLKPTGLSVETVTYTWTYKSVYNGGSYVQSFPSAIFVPKSVNGLANGRIWVVWYGYDAVNAAKNNVRISFSDDGGVTWSAMQMISKSFNADHCWKPSITANSNNDIFVVYQNRTDADASRTLRKLTLLNGGSWVDDNFHSLPGDNPSTLFDLNLDLSNPLTAFKAPAKVSFYGTWQEPVETPSLTAKAVYNIPSTDYVGAFVKKIGATNVQAYVNDVLADAELVDSEYQFVKQLDAEAPVKLRLELSRVATTGGESDAVTRILGGRA